MINEEFEQVKDFHKTFNCPYRETPNFLPESEVKRRAGFMTEEIQEFTEAENIYDQADAMIDLIYFALGTLVEMGVQPKNLFDIVHNANINKLWEDGRPHYREEDKKVVKPKNWQNPYPKIKEEIDRQKI